jgi:hypothetical protein
VSIMPRLSVVRKLTTFEHALLRLLIVNGLGKDSPYLEQVAEASVVGQCDCGCGTIDLAVSGQRPKSPVVTTLVDAQGVNSSGQPVEVILFARDGFLSSLEVFSPTGQPGTALPTLESVSVY